MIVEYTRVKVGTKSSLNRRNDRKCRFLIKLAMFNGSFIEAISCRKFKGSKHELENDKLYYQKHRHTFYSPRIFLDRKMLYLKVRFSLLQHGAFERHLGCSAMLLVCPNVSNVQFKERNS